MAAFHCLGKDCTAGQAGRQAASPRLHNRPRQAPGFNCLLDGVKLKGNGAPAGKVAMPLLPPPLPVPPPPPVSPPTPPEPHGTMDAAHALRGSSLTAPPSSSESFRSNNEPKATA